jgi:hypothetical protein
MPLGTPKMRERTRIIGNRSAAFEQAEPELFRRYEHMFIGEVPSLLDFYTSAKVVLAPAMAGTGRQSLDRGPVCGKPILTTRQALRVCWPGDHWP